MIKEFQSPTRDIYDGIILAFDPKACTRREGGKLELKKLETICICNIFFFRGLANLSSCMSLNILSRFPGHQGRYPKGPNSPKVGLSRVLSGKRSVFNTFIKNA